MTNTAANSDNSKNFINTNRPWKEMLSGSVASITLTFVIVIALGLILVGPRFLSFSNVSIMGNYLIIPLVVGAFAGFALLSGVVDLSIGSMVGFSTALMALLLNQDWGIMSAGLVTLVFCMFFGGINAICIVGFGAGPIPTTLGMLTALRGITWLICGPSYTIPAFNLKLFTIVNHRFLGIPSFFLVGLLLTLIITLIVSKSRVGRHIKAVGGDEQAAERAGISVKGVRVLALILSALGAGIGGIIMVAQITSATRMAGFGLEFEVYAALMIGGYSILRGGVGNPLGGALGILVVGALGNIIDLTASSSYYTNIIVGILLLSAVYLDRLRGGDSYD